MNTDLLQSIASQIRAAREAKALSQRAMAQQVGIPQSHISRIERGAVDLQLSSLIEIARALDLEVVLVPRNSLPAVAALSSRLAINETPDTSRARSKINSLRLQATKLARRFPQTAIFKRLSQTLLDLRDLQLEQAADQRDTLTDTTTDLGRVLRHFQLASADPPAALLRLAESLERDLRTVRDVIAHGGATASAPQTPAYTLGDNESGDV